MQKLLLFILLFFFSMALFSQNLKSGSKAFFAENKGQLVDQEGKENSEVHYLYHSNGLNIQLKKEGFSYDVYEVQKTLKITSKKNENAILAKGKEPFKHELKYQFHRVDIDFLGANKNAEIIAEGRSVDYENYYNLPNKPTGIEKIYRYEKITYKNIYAKIDLVFFKPEDTLKPIEYNFIVNPGGKISDIKFQVKGTKTKLKDGKISMDLRFGEMQENIPHSWVEGKKSKENLSVIYKDLGNDTYGFTTSQDIFDKKVVIDPVPTRIWGSYFGGNGEEFGWIKPDRLGNVFLHGYTTSSNNVATSGTYQSDFAGFNDAFINKINKDGQRIWGTYYGGIYDDFSGGLDFDQNDNIYLAADTHIPDPAHPGNHLYYFGQVALLKFNPDGTLIYEKIFGGNQDEVSLDLKFYNNNIYIIGETYSDQHLATPGAFQENIASIGMQSGFIGKFNAADGVADWVSYITGNAGSMATKIFNADNGIEIIAETRATNFPMVNAFQPTSHITPGSYNNNGLYLKFSENGSLIRSSYVGEDESYYFDSARRFGDEIFFGAHVYTKKYASFFMVNMNTNTVVEKNIPVVYNLQTSTYIDSNRDLFVAVYACPGDVGLNSVGTPNAFQPEMTGGCGSHFMKFDENLNKLYGTFYPGHIQIPIIIKDAEENIYFWGMNSGNTKGMTTPGTFQQTASTTDNDMIIVKFADCASNVTVSFTPTCINQNLQLKASGGTSYEWFGPNNYTSTLQNPVIYNAQANNSGEYFVRIKGGQSCGGIFSVMVNVGSTTLPVLDIPDLPNVTGFCNVIVTTFPTATTGCGTKLTATTTDPLSYNSPGNYVIHWEYNDGAGNTLAQNQTVIITPVAVPVVITPPNFCFINSPRLTDITITGTAIKWYDASGTLLNYNTLLVNGFTYFATQTLDGCESSKLPILVNVNDPFPPTGNLTQDFCSAQNPTIANIIVNGQDLKWYDRSGNLLPLTTLLVNGETYYGTQTVNGCESTQKIHVKVIVTNGGIPANDFEKTFCNDTTSNTKAENLNNYRNDIIANPAAYRFDFFDANNQVVPDPANVILNVGTNLFNVKVSNSLGCFVEVKLTLTLNPKPLLNLPPTLIVCTGIKLKLDAGPGFSSYQWTKDDSPTIVGTSEILEVSEAGKYSVTVKNAFLCENSASVIVTQAIIATIVGVQIVNNTATIQLSNAGTYQYILDKDLSQNSNVFKNLKNGNHTVEVKTELGCIIGSITFTIFSIPDNFSPNGDGKNDTWKISGLENYPGSEIQVFDRFGNLVMQRITNGPFEWGGFSNAPVLATGNYWYVVKVSDGRLLSGWVLLKNRN
ncbi:T9SS type B sorting domain-containing protein [Kaistella antarctica]|uniref:Gliding motility-associated C-terminal domain n=2 Tax=Kaistella antarctica TaxID=266748 RepID=A0A448NNS5_9FLAO|nr:T9SS type B sorting domain-containing protein [Kaistella antarctica]SEW09478.1 gliding motility-associated C-terminal domain-containing protein [Kaistella antarctica]VEH96864.1 gliding motility-associated C-terminal domain [Kaistella antarctica]